MIKCTAILTEGDVYIAVDQVRAVYTDKEKTHVVCGAVAYPVTESPQEVVRLITEAKHRKMKLQAAYNIANEFTTSDNTLATIKSLEAEDMP